MSEEQITEAGQYLTFTLDDEVFACSITRVREVLEFTTATRVPRTPEFMRGVINLRGNVVPVMDLRRKFGMGDTKNSIDTCVIIVEVELDGEHIVLGAMADSVQEVIDLGPDQIEPPPKIGTRLDTQFIQGMGTPDEEFIILLDIDRVFSAGDLELAQSSGEVPVSEVAATAATLPA
jgi:purine-binding chemotaxis protein CheW